jgi:hypothetical protein
VDQQVSSKRTHVEDFLSRPLNSNPWFHEPRRQTLRCCQLRLWPVNQDHSMTHGLALWATQPGAAPQVLVTQGGPWSSDRRTQFACESLKAHCRVLTGRDRRI